MSVLPWDEEWFKRCGRLEEPGDGDAHLLTGRLGRMSRAQYAMPVYRPSRPKAPGGGNSFYLSHTVIRRLRRGDRPRIPGDGEAPAGRVFVFPTRAMGAGEREIRQRRLDRQAGRDGARPLGAGMTAQLRSMGGVYDRKRQCWHVPKEMVAKRVVPPSWRGRAASASWLAKREGRPDTSSGTAARFQAYIERAEASDAGRRAEIESDAEGEISFGSIAADSAERIRFWEEAEKGERPGGRVQQRIIAELPHWLGASDRRRIAEGFCKAFSRLDLPFHAVVHLPDVDEGGDERNVHLHVVYHDRPASPGRDGGRSLKRREVAHIGWPGSLRRHFSRVVNEAIAEAASRGVRPPEDRGYYDPRTYAEMGVPKLPAQHMGAWRMRLERSGVPTLRGVRNGWKEGLWRVAEAARAEIGEARRLGAAAERVHDAETAHPTPNVRALARVACDSLIEDTPADRVEQVLDDVRRDFVVGRAVKRATWAKKEASRLRPSRKARRAGRAGEAAPPSPSELRRDRLREIELEALAVSGVGAVGPRSTQAERDPILVSEPDRKVGTVVGRILSGVLAERVVDEAERRVDAVERGALIERLKGCRSALAAAERRVRPETAPKRLARRSEGVSSDERGAIGDWRRRLLALSQAEAEAEAEALSAVGRLVSGVADADRVMGRDLGRPAPLSRVLEALGEETRRAPWTVAKPDVPVLTWIEGLKGKLMSGPEARREAEEVREAPVHPFSRRGRGRIGGEAAADRPATEASIEAAAGAAIAAVERWIERRSESEAARLSGPLPVIAMAEEEEAWRRRRRQLEDEARRLGQVALSWPLVRDASAPAGREAKAGGAEAALEQSWSRVTAEAARASRGIRRTPDGGIER